MKMGNYRIIKYTSQFSVTFKVQKRLFFGIWYNFNNIDGCTTGFYETKDEAIDAINRHKEKRIARVIAV